MVDASRSATLVPAQSVATVTSIEAPSPPADPLPAFVPPTVTDPVSNLDFLPVDDAFALELRSETIEQLVGGDALRRGESERIEAGRSQTNADRVAGRDRVRVQDTLHEHTGHGLAEVAAHLHTTVDGTLDIHAGNEDTVLLAGHMRDLWDGGTAIVAAMSDDTAAGGGIRVTTPLDLWVHGLMGMEERIGTCTTDAVLMESGATHYEREYGPGVHAAGLAVYTGSLYQSSRSTFRPLMRVSSGVRNLIAAGGGGGGDGDGGAGSLAAASPPPVQAHTGAAEESATGTLAAGRRAAGAPGTALDATDALTDPRRVPLEELVDSVDARVAQETGEAGTMVLAENLPELARCADTAEQLGALQATLRMDAAESGSEAAGGFRASELEGAVSMHPAGGGGRPLEFDPPSAVHGENARMVRPHPDVPWSQGPEMKGGLPGGADRPSQSPAPESDFIATYRRMRDLRIHYRRLSKPNIVRDFQSAVHSASESILFQFQRFGGRNEDLGKRSAGATMADKAYVSLQGMARRADSDGNRARAGRIRGVLDAIDKQAVERLQALCANHGVADATSTQAMQRPPVTAGPSMTGAAIPPPAHAPVQFDWIAAYWRLRDLARHFLNIDLHVAGLDFRKAADHMSQAVRRRFRKLAANPDPLLPLPSDATTAEQAYPAIEEMFREAEESDNAARAYVIRQSLEDIKHSASNEWDKLVMKYGALDVLLTQAAEARTNEAVRAMLTTRTRPSMEAVYATQDMQAMQRPLATAGPPVTVASTTVPPPSQFDIPGPAYPNVAPLNPAYTEPAGGLVHATVVPGPCAASSLPGPSLSEAADAESRDLWRGWLDRPATASGTTAAQPAATGNIVTPSLRETSSFWLQPVDPVRAPVSVPFDSGPHHAGETVQPPPVTTTASSTAPAPGAAYHVPSWVDGNFTVERALLAGRLPPGVDVSRLVKQAGLFAELGLAGELAAGRLPMQTIDDLIDGFQATDEGGGNALFIEYLRSLKETIERALRDAYSERADPRWLDQVRDLLLSQGELAGPSAASTTVPAEFDLTVFGRFLGAGEEVPHPAQPPPPSASGGTGAGAVVPPTAAGPWRIRPPGMGGAPRPVASDPWSAPPGPSSQVGYTRAIRVPVMSTGAPPRRQGAETPGFARAASGAIEVPFSHREAIALRFRADDALLQAEFVLQTGGGEALGWSATRWRPVLADLERLHRAIVRSNSTAAATRIDVDWRAIATLMRILDDPRPAP